MSFDVEQGRLATRSLRLLLAGSDSVPIPSVWDTLVADASPKKRVCGIVPPRPPSFARCIARSVIMKLAAIGMNECLGFPHENSDIFLDIRRALTNHGCSSFAILIRDSRPAQAGHSLAVT